MRPADLVPAQAYVVGDLYDPGGELLIVTGEDLRRGLELSQPLDSAAQRLDSAAQRLDSAAQRL